jgi:hypothetical protein
MRHCPQATSGTHPRTDLLFVEKQARHAQGYPGSFPQAEGELEIAHCVRRGDGGGEVPLWDKGFGVAPIFFQNPVDRLPLRRYVDADLGTTRIREAPNSSERGADRLSGAGSPDAKPSGTAAGGSTRAAVPNPFSDGSRHHRSRSRNGQANRGEGQPERGAPRNTELETAKGYSGLPRVASLARTRRPAPEHQVSSRRGEQRQ